MLRKLDEEEEAKKQKEKQTVVPTKKKKLNKADFQFKSIKDQTLIKRPGDINGIDFQIKDLENCVVIILDYTA